MSETYPWEQYPLHELEARGIAMLGRGNIISKKDMQSNPGGYPIYSSSAKGEGLFGTYGDYMFDEEMITWSVDGGGNLFHRPRHKFSVTNVSGYMRLDTSALDYRFAHAALALQHSKLTFDYQTKAHPSVIRNLYHLPIPPLPEQKKIAEILSGIDKAINKISEAIAKSETTLTGVFANLDLIASSGKTATLGEVVRVQNGYAFQSSIFSEDPTDIPLVRISNISGGVVDISKSKRIPRGLAPSDEYKVNRGDILIAMSGATTGKIGKYQGDSFCLLNQRVGKFVFRPGSDSAAYATQLLLSGFLESRILAKAAGGAQPNISGKGIEDIDIPFPDAADQEKYGSAIKELLRVNSRRRILVEKYQHLKASISSDLLSGRKRVSV
jgi:type I restriction enzyme, S subunit